MNILLASAPADYGYINLCYRFVELGEVAGYIKDNGYDVVLLDGIGEVYVEWYKKLEECLSICDVIVLHHTGENLSSTLQLVSDIRLINSTIPIAIYGIISLYSSKFFESISVNAIVVTGDWEAILVDWLNYISTKHMEYLRGLKIKSGDTWVLYRGDHRIPSKEWSVPLLEKLPLKKYKLLYSENNSIAGIKDSFELSTTVSRGCPYNCWYCQVPRKDGRSERRRSVDSVIQFLMPAMHSYGFDQVAFFSPTFTLEKKWVLDLCKKMMIEKFNYSWRCVTTQVDLDNELLEMMALAGCWRIGIGIETLNLDIQKRLGKPINIAAIPNLINSARTYGITTLFFLLDGLPNQNPGDAEEDAKRIIDWGGEVRISKLINYNQDTKVATALHDNKLSREVEFLHPTRSAYEK